jgi:hypothetical protein
MICENCGANVPKVYQSSDGRYYCCAGCLFHPNGCRCKYGDFGMVQDDIPYEEEDYPEACSGCDQMEDWCICNQEAY